MSLPATCQRKREGEPCGRPGTLIPAIDVYAPGSSAPATMLLGLPHCEECARFTVLDELLDDRGWAEVEATFRGIRRAVPDRAKSVLRWHHVDGAVVRSWQQAVEATQARAALLKRHEVN